MNLDLPDAEALPPPHPLFTRHFVSHLYDGDDFRNDDVAPFGTDEGWDVVHEWAERVDDLIANPTLRYILGDSADALIAELKAEHQSDVDNILIGEGFTLLRFAGQIDPEGRTWLAEALQRQVEAGAGPEYETMLEDLSTFDREPTRPGQEGKPTSTGASKPAKWLILSGGWNDPPHAKWLNGVAAGVMADDGWNQWWGLTTDVDKLTLAPRPSGRGDVLRFDKKGRHLDVTGVSATLTQRLWELRLVIDRLPDGVPLHKVADDVPGLFLDLIYRMLVGTGAHLGLPPVPHPQIDFGR